MPILAPRFVGAALFASDPTVVVFNIQNRSCQNQT